LHLIKIVKAGGLRLASSLCKYRELASVATRYLLRRYLLRRYLPLAVSGRDATSEPFREQLNLHPWARLAPAMWLSGTIPYEEEQTSTRPHTSAKAQKMKTSHTQPSNNIASPYARYQARDIIATPSCIFGASLRGRTPCMPCWRGAFAVLI
jgi:hypothetical protein